MRVGLLVAIGLGSAFAAACGSDLDGSNVEGNAASANGSSHAGAGNLNLGNGGNSSNGVAGGDAFDPNAACATSSAVGEPTPIDLYFMVDITGSMNCPVPDDGPCDTDPGPPSVGDSRWTVVSAALKSFMSDPKNQGLGVGLRFFPTQSRRSNICDANSYLTPAVEIGTLSTNAAMLTSSINMQVPSGTTPTVPSLTAAIAHASAWAKAHPSHRAVVVYATDGYPKGCTNNTIDAAAMVAKAGFDATPSIPTYVLGVGPNLMNLEQIAAAGSNNKTKAFLVDTTKDAAAQLTAALDTIRTSAVLDCTYTIPPPPKGEELDPTKVNVNYTSSSGAVTKVKQDPPGVACSAGSGWQYSADGKQINLCGSACSAAKADPGAKLNVLFGCSTEVGPPK